MPTVRRAIEIEPAQRGVPEVLAGELNVDRELRWVHAGEFPIVTRALRGGELLLTTGIGLEASSRARRHIRDLSERGLAGLAVELGSVFTDRLPKAVIEQANAVDLPLIVFHRQVRFVEITEILNREILLRRSDERRQEDQVGAWLEGLMLDGAGVAELIEALAARIGNAVALVSDNAGLLCHASPSADGGQAVAAWDAFERGLLAESDALEADVAASGGARWGRVIAFAMERQLDAATALAVAQAARMIALALLIDRSEELAGRQNRGKFLSGLMAIREANEIEVEALASGLGFEAEGADMLPVAVSICWPRDPYGREPPPTGRVWRELEFELASRNYRFLAGTHEHDSVLLLVVAAAARQDRRETADRLASVISATWSRCHPSQSPPTISIGPLCADWVATIKGLRRALVALDGGARSGQALWHDSSVPTLRSVVARLRGNEDVEVFAEARLGPLIEQDRDRKLKLLPTLAAYCASSGNKAMTARALQIERQSVYHRLEQIQRLLGVDLADPEEITSLSFALLCHEFGFTD